MTRNGNETILMDKHGRCFRKSTSSSPAGADVSGDDATSLLTSVEFRTWEWPTAKPARNLQEETKHVFCRKHMMGVRPTVILACPASAW